MCLAAIYVNKHDCVWIWLTAWPAVKDGGFQVGFLAPNRQSRTFAFNQTCMSWWAAFIGQVCTL